MATWLRREASGDLILTLHVQPGARKTEIAGLHGDALKIRLAAPPVEGKANACLVAFLAEALGISRSRVELASGASGRRKSVRLQGVEEAAALRLAEGLARG